MVQSHTESYSIFLTRSNLSLSPSLSYCTGDNLFAKLAYISISGPYYLKLGEGSDYTPGQDTLLNVPTAPKETTATAVLLVALGMSGVKSYRFDRTSRSELMEVHETGASPFSGATDLWQAQSSVFNLIEHLEPFILSEHLSSPWLGKNIITGLKASDDHFLLIAVSLAELATPLQFDLSPYRLTGYDYVVRYRIWGATVDTSIISASSEDTSIRPGEAFFWLFRRSSSEDMAPSVAFTTPIPNVIQLAGRDFTIEVSGDGIHSVEFSWNGQRFATADAGDFRTNFLSIGAVPRAGIWHSLSAKAYSASNSNSFASLARTAVMFKCDGCTDSGCPAGMEVRGWECVQPTGPLPLLTSEIDIDVGGFAGSYSVGGMTGCCFRYDTYETFAHAGKGSRTVPITYSDDSERQWTRLVKLSIGSFARVYFSLDTDGKIDYVTNPEAVAIALDGKTLSVKSVSITSK